jgi:ribosome biogenesis GTPase
LDRLSSLGFSEHFRAALESFPGFTAARVAAEDRASYLVLGEAGLARAELAGRLRHEARDRLDLPAVGDWVALDRSGLIRHLLPRRTALVRQAAGRRTEAQLLGANLDAVLVVTSADDDLSPRRIERYLAMAWDAGVEPVLVLSKCDLAPDPAALVASLGPWDTASPWPR